MLAAGTQTKQRETRVNATSREGATRLINILLASGILTVAVFFATR